MRARVMCDPALQAIFQSVIFANVLYASSAWCGFIKVADRQRVDAFLLRSKRCGYCLMNLPSFEELCKRHPTNFSSTRSSTTNRTCCKVHFPQKQLIRKITILENGSTMDNYQSAPAVERTQTSKQKCHMRRNLLKIPIKRLLLHAYCLHNCGLSVT